jgi:hypothetical protein
MVCEGLLSRVFNEVMLSLEILLNEFEAILKLIPNYDP